MQYCGANKTRLETPTRHPKPHDVMIFELHSQTSIIFFSKWGENIPSIDTEWNYSGNVTGYNCLGSHNVKNNFNFIILHTKGLEKSLTQNV